VNGALILPEEGTVCPALGPPLPQLYNSIELRGRALGSDEDRAFTDAILEGGKYVSGLF